MTTETKDSQIAQRPKSVKEMLADVKVKSRFEEILGKKAPAFISSIISSWQSNKALQECDPQSVIAAAAIAASLDLPINGNLGFAALVPYNGQVQFQIMARGFVQLAQRTGQYVNMNVAEVYEGQLAFHNEITGEMQFDTKAKKSDKVIGYVFYFKLLNGFEKYTYMTVDECKAHGKKYSKSYDNPRGKWQQDFPVMALKTVVKRGLSKWGPLSTDMQKAVTFDQAVVTPEGKPDYIDSTISEAEEVPAVASIEAPKRASEVKQQANPPAPTSELKTIEFSPSKLTRKGETNLIYDGEKAYTTPHAGVAALAKAAKENGKKVRLDYFDDGPTPNIEKLELAS